MTREEAIQILIKSWVLCTEGYSEARDMAIKALKQEPCDDCISRKQALYEFEQDQYHDEFCAEHNIDHSISMEMVRIRLNDLPPVTPQPKTGHWVEENINGYGRKVFCSECGCPPPFEHISSGDVYSANGYGVINKTKYCPNCGRRMIDEQGKEK